MDQIGTQFTSNVLKLVGLANCFCGVLNVLTSFTLIGKDYPEVLEKIKFSSISWTHDNKGVFYSCYPEQQGKTDGSETTSNENHKLFYHRLGTQQSEDILVVEFPHEPKWRM